MRDFMIVAKFTIKDMIKRKSFIISNVIILLIIVILFNIPNIIKSIRGDGAEANGDKLLIVDVNNVFEGALESLKSMDLNYDVQISEDKADDLEKIKQKIQNKEIDKAILIENREGEINLQYIVRNLSMESEVPQDLVNTITGLYSNLQISKLGLTQEQLQSLNPKFNLEMKQAEEEEVQGNQFAMMLLSLVLFYAIYFCAYQVSSSITTEKTSKIIETLVTSTTPKIIVLGKTIGIGIVGLLQISAMVVVALVSKKLFLEEGMLDGIIDFSTITPFLGLITALYFILGYAFYALLYALTGSTVSKPEDVQSANGPVAIVAVIGFYLAYFTMINPTSELNKIAAILPMSSPFCMPFRVMMGIATTQEICISLAVILVTIVVIAKVSVKIYSQAILNYGNKLGIKDMMKMWRNARIKNARMGTGPCGAKIKLHVWEPVPAVQNKECTFENRFQRCKN